MSSVSAGLGKSFKTYLLVMVVDGNEETLENIRVRGHVPKLTLLVELKSGGMTESNYLLNIEETQKFD